MALALSTCVMLETLSFTYIQNYGGTYYFSSSILYLLCGIGVCILPFIPTGDVNLFVTNKAVYKAVPYLFAVFILFLVGYHIYHLVPAYSTMPIHPKIADMLPCLQVACHRFLHGEKIYAPIPEMYPGCIMPYLPAMWVPFLPASALSFDFRWTTLSMQLLGISCAMIPLWGKKSIPIIPAIIAAGGLFLVSNYFLNDHNDYWTMTEEGVVAGFYLLLGFALLRQNYWAIGLAITGCTLSRYSLVMWIPVYFIFVFVAHSNRDFLKLLLSYSLSMLGLFILPFFIRDPLYFINIPQGYIGLTDRFWNMYGVADHRLHNVGLFKFFNLEQMHSMFLLGIITSFLAPVILIACVKWLAKGKKLNEKYLGYASFKVSLIFFFSFIQMPYLYIFVPVTLLSYVVLFDYLAGPVVQKEGIPQSI